MPTYGNRFSPCRDDRPHRNPSCAPGYQLRVGFNGSPLDDVLKDPRRPIALSPGDPTLAEEVIRNMVPPDILDGTYQSDPGDRH